MRAGRIRRITALLALLTLTSCGAESGAPAAPTPTFTENAPDAIKQAPLRMEELPGTWALEDVAPSAAAAETDASAQELNKCLGIPPTAQPQKDRTAYSMFFAENPRVEQSIIVNSSATLIANPSHAIDNIKAMRDPKMIKCFAPSVKDNATKQYQVMGYDVKDVTVTISPLAELQNPENTFAFRSSIAVLLNDGHSLAYFIDSFGIAVEPVFTTLTVFRDGEPPSSNVEKILLEQLRDKTRIASTNLERS